MRRFSILVSALFLVSLAAAPAANAALFGVESNGEFVNSDRTPALQAEALDRAKLQGATVVRANFGWNEIAGSCEGQTAVQLRDPNNACYSWSVADAFVQQATERNIQVLASVSRAPSWLHGVSDAYYLGTTSAQWTRTVEFYESFVGAMAQRYTAGSPLGTIRLWTVWNEPNSVYFFKPMHTSILRAAAPKRYAQLVARSAVAIKGANTSALVSIGPTGPQSTLLPIPYVKAVQTALPTFLPGGTTAAKRSWLAAWSHNPYPGTSTAPSRGTIKSPKVGMTNIRDLFTQLDAAPITRGMKVWATEFGYQTNPPDMAVGISAALQGRYMGEAYDWLESTRRVTVLIWYGLTDPTDLGDWQSGTYYSSGQAKVSRAWAMRPISVPVPIVRKGTTARVWARSMVNPAATRIAYSYDGRSWRLLPLKGRKADGTTVVAFRVVRTMYVATWDGTRGPARTLIAR